ncbi:MAG TPA: hypothetical protein VF331_24520 [Polyangiales bacterium]
MSLNGKTTTNSGATWQSSPTGAAVLITDLGAVRDVASLSVSQMFSDARTQEVQVYAHARQLGGAPAWDDLGWSDISGGWHSVREGTPLQSSNPNIAGAPLRLTLTTSVTARFLRLDARSPSAPYIELRSVKAFGP